MQPHLPCWVLLVLLAGCGPQDADQDGFSAPGDCDDDDASVHPEAAEICGNGVNDDCDGGAGDCRRTGRMSAAEADHVLVGPWLSAVGLQVDLADVSGDGVADLVVGEPGIYDSAGLLSAVWAWTFPLPAERVFLAAAPILIGDPDEGGLGTDLAIADLDADGRMDLVVTTPEQSYANPSEGLVLAWFGGIPTGTTSWWNASTLLYGGPDAYHFGEAVAVGDFDADGDLDLAASCPYDDAITGNGGSVSVFTGPIPSQLRATREEADLRIDGEQTSGYLGLRLQALPDADGDGDDELVVASPHEGGEVTTAGRLRVFGALLRGDDEVDDAMFTVEGTTSSEGLGWTSDVGDLDGDGLGDLVVGTAWGGDGTGAVLAWFGPLVGSVEALATAADVAIEGVEPWGRLGDAVEVDDVDGDGHDDLLVHTSSTGEGVDARGYLLVYYGPFEAGRMGPSDADLVIEGEVDEGAFGYGEPRAADLDGDGVPELVVAAPLADLQGIGSDSGAIYVFRGQGL
ncbi:FG-GAP-like repeat-containing protein [Myxococcota bacterium]|nr:FG-GAP-like repeat-containing protein [Myxococcota bacterium]